MDVNETLRLALDTSNGVTSNGVAPDTQTTDAVELTDSQLDQISGGRVRGPTGG